MDRFPLAYLITFGTYGSRLPGNERGWATRKEFVLSGEGTNSPDPQIEDISASLRRGFAKTFELGQRDAVLAAIVEVAGFREWELHAAHVRTNHVHVVVTALTAPEKVMADFKRRASYRLNVTNLTYKPGAWWSRHGSTRYLWQNDAVERAIRYTALEQGSRMSLYVRPGLLAEFE